MFQKVSVVSAALFKTAQPLLAESSALESEMTVEKVKRYKSNLEELFRAEGYENHKLTNSVWNKYNCLSSDNLFSEGSLHMSVTDHSINGADCHTLCVI